MMQPPTTPQDTLEPPTEGKPGMRILIAEDDPFTLTILQKRLVKGGYEVATATNGREGLQKVEEFKPDLILSDWMMPEMDGKEFCQRVKEDFQARSIYFILLTAKDKFEDKVSALDTGADEYLVKPCDGRELMARLRAAERILRLQQQLSQSNEQLQKALSRLNAEMEATSVIQRRLLPSSLPKVPGYGFAAHYQPSTECSGDFYDVLPLPDGRLGLIIGDVSGHGAPAMVAMAVTHMLLNLEVPTAADPAALLYNLNNKMCAFLPTDQYLTMFYGILEPGTGHLVYSSAGHNPPMLFDGISRSGEFLKGCEGFPIKLIGPNMEYTNQEITLGPTEHLVMYTDGLLEAFNDQDQAFGSDGLRKALATCRRYDPVLMLNHLLANLYAFTMDHPLDDDLSLLLVSRLTPTD